MVSSERDVNPLCKFRMTFTLSKNVENDVYIKQKPREEFIS